MSDHLRVEGEATEKLLRLRREAVARLVPGLTEAPNPQGEDADYTGPCPFREVDGQPVHSTENDDSEFRVWIRGKSLRVWCRHESCRPLVDQLWGELRRATEGGKAPRKAKPWVCPFPQPKPVGDYDALALARRGLAQRARIKPASVADLIASSPCAIPLDPREQTERFLALHDTSMDTPNLWIGMPFSSGRKAVDHFQPPSLWGHRLGSHRGRRGAPMSWGAFVSMGVFPQGIFARKDEFIQRQFFVFECDSADKAMQAGIILWLRDVMGLRLAAVVDAAGKSLHAWIHLSGRLTVARLSMATAFLCGCKWSLLPRDERPEKPKGTFGGLGGDAKMLNASQPARLPGVERWDIRDGEIIQRRRFQRLLYLDPLAASAA